MAAVVGFYLDLLFNQHFEQTDTFPSLGSLDLIEPVIHQAMERTHSGMTLK